MVADLNTSLSLAHVHLFGGEHEVCLPGMDGYVGPYDDMEQAMRVAESNQYDWAHITIITPLELKIVNVGRWNPGLKQMIWQADTYLTRREAYLKTFCAVMKGGVILLAQLPVTAVRMKLVMTATGLYEEIQSNLHTLSPETQGIAVYLIRQVITQMMTSVQRSAMPRKQEQMRRQWVAGASSLLKDTETLVFSEDRIIA